MPTASANELAFEPVAFKEVAFEAVAFKATWIGAAIARGPRRARVHSAFRSAINFVVEGSDNLAALTGSSGNGLPNAIALKADPYGRDRPDFRDWPTAPGSPAFFDDDFLAVGTGEAQIRVDLRLAARGTRQTLPAISRLGLAFRAAVAELSRKQAELECDLRIETLLGGKSATTALGRRLASAARELGAAVRRGFPDGSGGRAAKVAVWLGAAGILGLGSGLTPSGDDFLCGFLCAAGCSAEASGEFGPDSLVAVLGEAVEEGISATGAISASFLRCASRGFFSRDLYGAAVSIAQNDAVAGAASIRRLCGLGHSSGADTATGFLYGLSVLTSRLIIERLFQNADAF